MRERWRSGHGCCSAAEAAEDVDGSPEERSVPVMRREVVWLRGRGEGTTMEGGAWLWLRGQWWRRRTGLPWSSIVMKNPTMQIHGGGGGGSGCDVGLAWARRDAVGWRRWMA